MEVANVFNVVFQHHQPVNAKAPGKARIFARVNAAFASNDWMDHAAATKFYPAGLTTNIATSPLAKYATSGKLKTWLSEWKIKRLDFNFNLAFVIAG